MLFTTFPGPVVDIRSYLSLLDCLSSRKKISLSVVSSGMWLNPDITLSQLLTKVLKSLKNSVKELLTRERKRKNRDRIARSHSDKYGAAASPRSAGPSRSAGREKSQSTRGSRPTTPEKSRSPSPTSRDPQVPLVWLPEGSLQSWQHCPFQHWALGCLAIDSDDPLG